MVALAPVAKTDDTQTFEMKKDRKYLVVCDYPVSLVGISALRKAFHANGVDAIVVAGASPEALKLYELDSK